MIHYSINKDDLYRLLRTIGLLQANEQILFINNADLSEIEEKRVTVAVFDAANTPADPNLPAWTDEELHKRFLHLAALQASYQEQRQRLSKELEHLLHEIERRSGNLSTVREMIPDEIDQSLTTQILAILNSRNGA